MNLIEQKLQPTSGFKIIDNRYYEDLLKMNPTEIVNISFIEIIFGIVNLV